MLQYTYYVTINQYVNIIMGFFDGWRRAPEVMPSKKSGENAPDSVVIGTDNEGFGEGVQARDGLDGKTPLTPGVADSMNRAQGINNTEGAGPRYDYTIGSDGARHSTPEERAGNAGVSAQEADNQAPHNNEDMDLAAK